MNNKIDFVITWVDDSDEKWLAEKEHYMKLCNKDLDVRSARYRNWNNLKYWFRGVEMYAPWVNKVYFVTYGHIPKWLNTNNPKLVIVNHKDYMPSEILPTFNSKNIEMHMHKIPGLSENFVYFNDDMFIINKTKPTDFFKNDLPCDFAVLAPIIADMDDGFPHTLLKNMELINKYFSLKEVIKNNFFKWFNFKYSYHQIRTLLLMGCKNFPGMKISHLPISYKKSTFELLWKLEYDFMNESSFYRFRNNYCSNHWIAQNYQVASGKFSPRSLKFGKFLVLDDENYKDVCEVIKSKKYKTICLNDSESIKEFDLIKENINKAFDTKLSKKSSFEI